jgi:hypothetical protein
VHGARNADGAQDKRALWRRRAPSPPLPSPRSPPDLFPRMALELKRRGHARHCTQVLSGLPAREVGADGARAALAFYCVGALDVLGALGTVPESKREEWRGELWRLQAPGAFIRMT